MQPAEDGRRGASATRATSRCGRAPSRTSRRGQLALAVGPRPARLAHRVLGDGRRSTSARSSTSTAAGSTCASRTTRTRSRSPGRPGCSSPATGCTTACSTSGEKMSKSLGNVVDLRRRRCSSGAPGRAALLPRRPALPLDDRATPTRRCDEAAAAYRRIEGFVRAGGRAGRRPGAGDAAGRRSSRR